MSVADWRSRVVENANADMQRPRLSNGTRSTAIRKAEEIEDSGR